MASLAGTLFCSCCWLASPWLSNASRRRILRADIKLPVRLRQPPGPSSFQYLDVAVLAASLGLASWLVYKQRSRKGLIALSISSLLYFGFWKKGCVCAIGSVQNVALALCDRGYAVPLGVSPSSSCRW